MVYYQLRQANKRRVSDNDAAAQHLVEILLEFRCLIFLYGSVYVI